ncbi:Regulator of chromosome condensation (RCC1) repeat [Plasmodiophora brassicae]
MSIEHDDSEGALVPFGDRGKDDGAPNEAVDFGPAPGIKRRQLIFDSLRKITDSADPASRRSIDSSGGTYVYTWGAGYHGQLGRKFTRGQKKYASVPQYVAFPEPVAIRQVACGGLHTAAVSDDGKVYTWGDGRMGQLGQVHEGFVNQPTPRAVKTLSAFVVAVACGQSHTVVLTDKGRLYSWGFSRYGQTGHGDRQMVKIPKLVDTEKNVEFTHIACGDKHSVALSRTGRVFSFGCGEHGQLGHGDQADQLRPTVIQSLAATRITSLRCGAIFTCMIADAGELHICGFGEYFYPNTDHNFMYLPRKFAFSSRISSVSCGQSHIVALSAKGEVYCVGAGEYGQLGHGVRGNLSVPRLIIASKDIVQVAAGRYHSLALTNFGAIYSWGNNDNGQLGQDTDDNLLFPRVIDHILGSVVGQIECGEHHSVALTSIKWAALGNDMHEWFLGQKQEHLLKLRYLKKSNYGLGKKELGKIREEMSTWMKSRQKTRELTKDDEAKDTKAQLESIRSRDAMSHEVNEQIESERRASKSAKPAAVAALPVKERTVSLDPSDMQVSPQTPAPPPGKHSVSDQVRARQKRMKQLSKQLNALLSARTESKLQAANAEANAVVLPAIPHTDRTSDSLGQARAKAN